jgi:hypothetical protein
VQALPDGILSIDASDGKNYALVVEKATQRLWLYSYDGQTYSKVIQVDCSTGEIAGTKTRAGDKKTPEGVYFFTDAYEDRYLTPIYGTRAFPMDYPNLLDRRWGRGGSAIWMHGTDKPLKKRNSNGCVALQNHDIDFLARHITLNRTPIIVTEHVKYASRIDLQKEKSRIEDFINRWGVSLNQETSQDFQSFYDPSFLPDLSWWTEWQRQRKSLAPFWADILVGKQGLSIYRHNEIYVVLVRLIIQLDRKIHEIGFRKLFISENEKGLSIIGDEYQFVPEYYLKYTQDPPLVAVLEKAAQGITP